MLDQTYTIKLQQFEGPFDLLLFFIERDELDINDIPIATITEDFLKYIRQAEEMNIDLASEFILVAATLIRIKAKMLIPRKEIDELGNEIDPRTELVQKLLEYKRYKEVIDDFSKMEDDQFFRVARGNVEKELKVLAQKALAEAEWESLTLFSLIKTFQKVMERFEKGEHKIVHHIFDFNYTIADQQSTIFSKISIGSKTKFEEIFEHCENRIHAIVTFLALLELLNMQKVHLTKGEGINQFWVSESVENEVEEGAQLSQGESHTDSVE